MRIEFDINEYIKNIAKSTSYYHTFINRDNLAAGVLRLDPGKKILNHHMRMMKFTML